MDAKFKVGDMVEVLPMTGIVQAIGRIGTITEFEDSCSLIKFDCVIEYYRKKSKLVWIHNDFLKSTQRQQIPKFRKIRL